MGKNFTWWNDTVTLAFPVRHLAKVIDNDVTCLAGGLGTDDSFHRNNFSLKRLSSLVCGKRNARLIVVWVRLEEILGFAGCLSIDRPVKKIKSNQIVIYFANSKAKSFKTYLRESKETSLEATASENQGSDAILTLVRR